MGLAYKSPLAALTIFNVIYCACWLIVDRYPKSIACFMERVGDTLSWIDPFIGDIPREDLVLRNVCSFSLGLLNLTYLHTSGTTVTIFILFLIGFGLVLNVLIGLRLIKVSGSVKLHTSGFIGQIFINGYNNIVTIYNQFKNKQLPKAGRYSWAIALIMGLNFTSPSYCMSGIETTSAEIDASLTGEGQHPREDEEASPTGESRKLFRRVSQGGQYAQRQVSAAYEVATSSESQRLGRDLLVGVASGTAVAGGGYVAGEFVPEGTSAGPEEVSRIEQLELEIAKRDKTIRDQQATISKQAETINTQAKLIPSPKQSTWFDWFNCFKKQQEKTHD